MTGKNTVDRLRSSGQLLRAIVHRHAAKLAGVGVGSWLLGTLFLQNLLAGLILAMVVLAGCLVLLYEIPIFREKERMQRVEAELPLLLLEMAVQLQAHRSFEKILHRFSEMEPGFAQAEFRRVWYEIHWKGASVPMALQHLSERVYSPEAKRAVIQLVYAYDQGNAKRNRGGTIKRIARELLAKQRIQTKEFASKLALVSMVFIAVSAIMPALFQSYITIGSSFLAVDFSPQQVLLITALGFPLLDAVILLAVRLQTPVFLR